MQVEDLSPWCKTHSEVVESLFWHYAMSTKYWTVLNTKGLDNTQISLTWNEWLKYSQQCPENKVINKAGGYTLPLLADLNANHSHILSMSLGCPLLQAIRDRLTLALQLNIECIEVESNVVIVVKFITNVAANNLALSTLVNDCKSLMSKFVSIALKHIYREGSQCANKLARLWSSFQQENSNTFHRRDLLCREPQLVLRLC
ncbi:hypothetical protein Goshw_005183 [Gossypium schwendimanii]|uniref:RNase H type-1 domain-containing protein n=1 Tax=Gossypium schwendimanii TaxID=34291 RepID=A0A7J9MRN3_GOSSC|nr:hypothetical protein [Gossypium schwendimanii]